MESNEKIAEYLFQTRAFQILDTPVILTSGNLGIYYINTENLLQDEGKWEEYAENPAKMINHSLSLMETNPLFNDVINILANKIKKVVRDKEIVISGGQRRDWPFSGPVSKILEVPHVSIYKDGRFLLEGSESLEGMYIAHVADLMTKGSSAYDSRNEPPTGWIQILRDKGAIVDNLFNIVTRLQGGEEILGKAGVNTTSLVAINQEFLEIGHQKGLIEGFEKNVALNYMEDPEKWSETYLEVIGIQNFVLAFDPMGKKAERAQKFLRVYQDVLKSTGRMEELKSLVKEKYDIQLEV